MHRRTPTRPRTRAATWPAVAKTEPCPVARGERGEARTLTPVAEARRDRRPVVARAVRVRCLTRRLASKRQLTFIVVGRPGGRSLFEAATYRLLKVSII